jgi:large subunit ribosomal protein L22
MAATRMEEQLGTRAVLRYCRMSAFKVRPVLDLIRGRDLEDAQEMLRFVEREAARVVGKLLASAVANAENNDLQSADELYVSACFADEGTTMKRWRPRARGRATRIRKRTCHITIVVTRLPDDRLARRQARDTGDAAGRRARRVAGARRQRVAASQAVEAGALETSEEAAPAVGPGSDEAGATGDAASSGPASEAAATGEADEAETGEEAADLPEGAAAEPETTDNDADNGADDGDEKEKRKK